MGTGWSRQHRQRSHGQPAMSYCSRRIGHFLCRVWHYNGRFATRAVTWVRRALVTLIVAILMTTLRIYRFGISPFLPPHCRFQPTCSEYAMTAISTNSLPTALTLIIRRVLRCHPFTQGGLDPAPMAPPVRSRTHDEKQGCAKVAAND